jgi:hypothetical protein
MAAKAAIFFGIQPMASDALRHAGEAREGARYRLEKD